MPHIAMDYKKYLLKRPSRKSHSKFRGNTLHKLVALAFNLLSLYSMDWTMT